MAKISALSGFPEWLPSERLLEQHVIDVFREVAELHGFSGIETRAVEPLDQLLRKGEIDKEVYVLRRLQAEDGTEDATADPSRTLGLHFDLTVPLARYVLEHQNDLAFPLRRYQIQKVWRGERPQDGRFREFYQADLDVIGQDSLPGHVEAEVAVVMAEILSRLPLPPVRIHANTRRLSEGFFRSIGFADHTPVLRALDKLPKIGDEAVARLLREEAGATEEQAAAALAFAGIRTADASFAQQVRDLGGTGEMLEQGIAELTAVLERVEVAVPGVILADLSIARGLDYYTGTVYETVMLDHPEVGSICSGGRYDNLAEYYTDKQLPGVGISIGLTRLFSVLEAQGYLNDALVTAPADVLILPMTEELSPAISFATALRDAGVRAQLHCEKKKFKQKLSYADKLSIPYAAFLGEDEIQQNKVTVKDLTTGQQQTVTAGEAVALVQAGLAARAGGTPIQEPEA